ncbi:hypothetical protein ME763_37555 (plasmid) [Streptomyces murinus]|uniref:hypothetical protein n=1 Tax=Streptomyces murinus TaxID=33900 RepID=UPI0023791EA1|nr:hypothetical protein [Streptomyces murinus]WDO11231.1 hypothetical protein ME763_37555 [Streptomyces murinus]
MRRLSQLASADLDPGRRRLLGAGVYSLAALAAWPPRGNPLTGPSAGLPHAPGRSGRAGLAEAEQMRTMARVFAEAAQLHGPVHVRTALTAYLGRDVTGYLNAPAVEAERRQLLSGAAELTILLGTMCAGDGADALAQHYHGTAASLAAEAGDAATYAIALRTMSAHAHDLGHHSAAVLHLAQRAADVAPPIVAAYTQAHLAVIQAHHSKRAALAALAAAERHHGQAHDTIPGPFTHYPASALHYQRARTLATLRDRGGATSALTTSLRLRAPGERQATALTQARLAETLLAGGHLDAALTHWQAFLKDYPTLHSSHAERLLQSMRRLLNPHRRHPATNTLLTEAATLH